MKKAATILLGLLLMLPTVGLSKRSPSSRRASSTKTHHARESKKRAVATTTDSGAPNGAKARCMDRTYSAATSKGACSHHGGVDVWIQQGPRPEQQPEQ